MNLTLKERGQGMLLSIDKCQPYQWLTEKPCLDENLPICKAQESMKPECTPVHEARFYNLADFCSNAADG